MGPLWLPTRGRGSQVRLGTTPPPPSDNLVAWYRASDLTAGAVASWADASGNGNSATQATSADQPICTANVVNGQNVVRFDGTGDELQTASFAQAAQGTLYVVFSPRALMVAFARCVEIGANTNIEFGNGSGISTVDAYYQPGGGLGISSSDLMLDAFYIASFIVGPDSSPASAYLNGALIASSTTGAMSTAIQPVTIGNFGGGGSFFWNGDIAEIFIYSQPHDSTDQNTVQKYLSNKFGIAI